MHERESLKNPNVTGDDGVNPLATEYHRWTLGQGLELGSPDQHVFDETLTPAQRIWLASRLFRPMGIWERRPTRTIEK